MFSRAASNIVRFAKPYTPTQCFFPAANTPLKRALCAATGMAVAGGTIYVSKEYMAPYVFDKIWCGSKYAGEHIASGLDTIINKLEQRRQNKRLERERHALECKDKDKDNEESKPNKFQEMIFELMTSPFFNTTIDYLGHGLHYLFKGCIILLDCVYIVAGAAISIGSGIFCVTNVQEWFKSIAKTSECCDIVRHTGITCLKMPLFGIIIIGGLTMSYASLEMLSKMLDFDNPAKPLVDKLLS